MAAIVLAAAVVATTAAGSDASPQGPATAAPSAYNPCPAAGLDSVTTPDGRILCTHGPDRRREIPDSAPPPLPSSNAGPEATPGIACQGDGVSGRRVNVIYAVPSDKPDRYASVLDQIRQVVAGVEAIVANSTPPDARRHIRWETDAGCNLVIHHVTMSEFGDDNFQNTIQEAWVGGGDERKSLIFVDSTGNGICGIGTLWPGDDPSPATNHSNIWNGQARIDNQCWTASAAAHELFHTFGAVQANSPHHSVAGHCLDDFDLMCYYDGGEEDIQFVCMPPSVNEALLDCNDDDYWNTNPPPGSYLATHWNTANSGWLDNGGTGWTKRSITIGSTYTPIPGDFNGDHVSDVFFYRAGTASDTLWRFNTAGNHTATPQTQNGTFTPIPGDFNGDGITDILWNKSTGADQIWLFNSSGGHSTASVTIPGTFKAVPGDFNGDHRTDILAYVAGTGADKLNLAGPDGRTFTVGQTLAVTPTYKPVPGDFDRDGIDDVFWHAPGAAQDVIWFFTNAGAVRGTRNVNVAGTFVPVPGDFDANGWDDAFLYATSGPDLVLQNDAQGTYLNAAAAGAGFKPIPGDFNGDGRSDLLFYAAGSATDSFWVSAPIP